MAVQFLTSTGLQFTAYNPAISGGIQIYANVPAGNNGRLMIAIIDWRRVASLLPATITMPGDWDEEAYISFENSALGVYSKYGDGSVAPFPIEFSTNVEVALDIILWDKASSSDPVGDTATNSNSNTFVHVAPSVTSAVAGSVVVHIWGAARGADFAVETTGLQVLGDYPPGDIGAGFAAGFRVLSSPGPSGVANVGSYAWGGATGPVYNAYSINASIIIEQTEAPSAPAFIAPVEDEVITIERVYEVRWTPSVDPNIATSLLDYELRYTKDGVNYTTITAHTAAGATSEDWDTTGLTPGNYQLSLRAWNGTEYGPYIYQTVELRADTVPLAPTNLQPNSNAVKDRTLTIRLSYQFNDIGDTQKAHTIEYSYNNFSSVAGTIVATTINEFTDVAGSTFTAGPVYWRVKTKDEVGDTYGPFSGIAVFQALDPPPAPVITTPLAVSPPTSANPNHGWTSTGQDQYKVKLVDETLDVIKHDGAYVRSGLKLIPSPITYKNLHQYGFYLWIKDINGLESAFDYESFLVAFTPPPTPLINVVASNLGGFNQVSIENPSTPQPEFNEVWRFKTATETVDDAILISPPLDPGATFRDSLIESGVDFSYFIRAYLSTGGFADSLIDTGTVTLNGLYLVVPTKESQIGNATAAALVLTYMPVVQDNEKYAQNSYERKQLEGRLVPMTVFGQTETREISYNLNFTPGQRALLRSLDDLFNENAITCAMDREGNKIFSRFTKTQPVDTHAGTNLQVTFPQTEYTEAVPRT